MDLLHKGVGFGFIPSNFDFHLIDGLFMEIETNNDCLEPFIFNFVVLKV